MHFCGQTCNFAGQRVFNHENIEKSKLQKKQGYELGHP